MQRHWQAGDAGLTARMTIVMILLALLYLAFIAFLAAQGADAITLMVIAVVLLGVQYFFSDKIALASVRARVVSADEAPELHALVERLVQMADMPKPQIAIVPSAVPNAFATGRGPGSSTLAVTRGLLDRLDRDEMTAVLAHELTHVRNRDVLVMTIASFFALVAQFIMRSAMWGSIGRDRRRGSNMLLIYLASIVVWFISFILIRTLSRYREYAADRGAALLTGAPSQLASALTKISGTVARIPDRDLREVEGMNALFIIPAISHGSIMNIFATHPPVEDRIERLMRMAADMERPA